MPTITGPKSKKSTQQVSWPWFIIGCVFLATALTAFFWAFSIDNLSSSRRFLLMWLLPIASGFGSGCFAGSIKLTGPVGSAVVAATGGFAVWLLSFYLLPRIPEPPTATERSINANNSPVLQFSSNSQVTTTINYGVSDDTMKQITAYVQDFQRRQERALLTLFPEGYVLFAATKSEKILPFKTDFEDKIRFDWKTGYSVHLTEDQIFLRPPDFTINNEAAIEVKYHSSTFGFARRVGSFQSIATFGKDVLNMVIVSTNEQAVVIAVGLIKREDYFKLMDTGIISFK